MCIGHALQVIKIKLVFEVWKGNWLTKSEKFRFKCMLNAI